jgi:predicted Zn-dependent peptidase
MILEKYFEGQMNACKLLLILLISLIMVNISKAYNITELDNGLTLITEKYDDSNVVVVDFWVKTGSLYENEKNNGASHFMEHMFFQGTEKRPGNTADYIKTLGATYNGATSQDFVHYYIEAPKDQLSESIDIIADMLSNAVITEKKFNEEKGVILAELASRQSEPMTYLYDKYGSVIFNPEYPYSKPVGGTYDVINKMTIDELKYFYDHFYTKDRIAVVITGNFDENKIGDIVKRLTANIKEPKDTVDFTFTGPAVIAGPKNITEKRQTGGVVYGKIGWIGVESTHSDYPSLLLLGYILSGGTSARLDQKIVTTGLASGVSMDFSPTKLKSDFSFTFITTIENSDKVKSLILDEIKKIKDGDITEEELKRMKTLFESQFEMGKERPISQASALGYYWTSANLELYNNLIQLIKNVNSKDIVSIANKYLKENNYAYFQILPEN